MPGAASADAAGEARQAGVLLGEPRQRVLELRELHLELAVAALGALGEDVEDELGAVDRLQAGGVLESAGLGRFQVDVEDRHGGAPAHRFEDDLLQLAGAHHGARVDLRTALARGAGDGHPGGADQLQGLREMLVVRHQADHQGALLVGRPGVAGDAGEFLLQGAHRGVHVEIELVHVRRLDALEGREIVCILVRAGRRRREVGQLDAAGQAVRQHLDGGDQVEAQERQVVQVVLGQRLALEMGVHEAQTAETADTAAQTTHVGKVEALGVAEDDVADDPVAAEEDADLAAEPPRDLGQVARQLGRDHLARVHAAAVGAFEGAQIGGLDAAEVAVNRV